MAPWLMNCWIPENIYTLLTEEIGISRGVGGSVRPKSLKKMYEEFPGGGGVRGMGGMDIFWNYTIEGLG